MSKLSTKYIVNFQNTPVSLYSTSEFKGNSIDASVTSSGQGVNKYDLTIKNPDASTTNAIGIIDFSNDSFDESSSIGVTGYSVDVSVSTSINKYDTTKTYYKDIKNSGTYALLRTNPKLTGNIKLVIDSKNNLYLDSFNVNNTLSKNKYHKIPVSYRSFYGRDVMSAFRDVVTDDLYGLPSEYKTIFSDTRTLRGQYADLYRCGASTNTNDLYKESFSMFAPIRLGQLVPDFFVIFRLNNSVPQTVGDSEIFQYLIENGEQIKTFDLRESSNIGKYLKESQQNAIKVTAPIYMTKTEDAWNAFFGISVDKGVVTEARELSHKYNVTSDIDLEYMMSTGFERHRLVAHDILNIEYMFDDPNVGQFSTNTYYGLYLYANTLDNNIYGLTENGVLNFKKSKNEVISLHNVENKDSYIVGFTTDFGDGFYRTTSKNEDSIKAEVSDRLGANVIYCDANKCEIDNKYSAFVTFTINSPLTAGEHFRVIKTSGDAAKMSSVNRIYEVIFSNSGTYAENKHGLSEESIYNSSHNVTTRGVSEEVKYVTHAIAVSVDGDVENNMSEQVDRLYRAFKSFEDAPFGVYKQNNTFIIYAKHDNVASSFMFERISGLTGHDSDKETLLSQVEDDSKKVVYFGNYEGTPIMIDPEDGNDALYSSENPKGIMMNPFFFETLGKRIIYGMEFINVSSTNYTLYEGSALIQDGILSSELCFIDNDGNVREYADTASFELKMLELKVDSNGEYLGMSTKLVNYIYSFNNPSKYMFRYPVGSNIKKIALYDHRFIDYVVCGIFPMKDFDSNMNATQSKPDVSIMCNYAQMYDEGRVGTFEDLYKSGVFTYSESPVSRTSCGWVTNGTGWDDASLKQVEFVRAVEESDYDIKKTSDPNKNPFLNEYSYDMSKMFTESMTIRDAYISGDFTSNDIIQEIYENNTIKNITKVHKVGDDIVSYVTTGAINRIKILGTEASDIADAIENTNLYVLSSPFVLGETGNPELYIDEANGISILVVYGNTATSWFKNKTLKFDGSFVEETTSDKIYYPIPKLITINDLNIIGSPQKIKVTGINEFLDTTSNNILLYSDDMCIYGTLNYNPTDDYATISNVRISSDYGIGGVGSVHESYTMNERLEVASSQADYVQGFDYIMSKRSKFTVFITNPKKKTQKELSDITVFIKTGTENFTRNDSETSITIESIVDGLKYPTDPTDPTSHYYIPAYFTQKMVNVFGYEKNEQYFDQTKNSCIGKIKNIWNQEVYFTTYTPTELASNSGYDKGKSVEYKAASGQQYKLSNNSFSQKLFIKTERNASGSPTHHMMHGYESGYLIKTFVNSLAIQRKNENSLPEITISKWPKIHRKKNKIYFDLSNATINSILANVEFNKIWVYLGITNEAHKRRYILNTIMPMIKFDARCQIDVKFSQGSSNSFLSSTPTKSLSEKLEKLANPSAKIIKQNGVYYIELEPNSAKIGTYSVSCKINM